MIKLYISDPEGKQAYNILWLELNTNQGNVVIQPGHAPMIVSLAPHKAVIFQTTDGKQQTINIKGGVAEITRDTATLLLEYNPQ